LQYAYQELLIDEKMEIVEDVIDYLIASTVESVRRRWSEAFKENERRM